MTGKSLSNCWRMISPNSPSWRGVNRSFPGSRAGASNGGQVDWAPAAEARKIKIEKRMVKRMAYPPGTVAAESNTRPFHPQETVPSYRTFLCKCSELVPCHEEP